MNVRSAESGAIEDAKSEVRDNEVQRSLGRIEGKLDSLVGIVNVHVNDDQYNFKEIKTRVSIMEKKMYVFFGALAILYPIFSHGISVAFALLK